mmetsp:Transcript_29396/g.44240  ORF Transcript_29396/g.44240 Transcript_29396/m.44240 type:complete len:220 (-) Transcript_29396:17-676(-)
MSSVLHPYGVVPTANDALLVASKTPFPRDLNILFAFNFHPFFFTSSILSCSAFSCSALIMCSMISLLYFSFLSFSDSARAVSKSLSRSVYCHPRLRRGGMSGSSSIDSSSTTLYDRVRTIEKRTLCCCPDCIRCSSWECSEDWDDSSSSMLLSILTTDGVDDVTELPSPSCPWIELSILNAGGMSIVLLSLLLSFIALVVVVLFMVSMEVAPAACCFVL